MQIRKFEDKIYEELKKNKLFIFKIKDLCLLLKINETKAYNIIKSLKRKQIIKKTGKNFFVFNESNEFIIGQSIHYPSYLSFWSALNYYGFSDQTPKVIFFATTKYSQRINNFKYVTISKKRFFGYTRIGELIIAEKEKAIIDSLLFPKYSGGLKEIAYSLQSGLKEIDVEKLIQYGFNVESKAVLRRLGFILDELHYKKELKKIKENIGKGYELLDPNLKRKNNLNKKWLLDINW